MLLMVSCELMTVKVPALSGMPLTRTSTGPVVAPVGTSTMMVVLVSLRTAAEVPLKVTVALPPPSSSEVPVMVTGVPTGPLRGEIPAMAG